MTTSWGDYLCSRPKLRMHDVCGRESPQNMPGKPTECLNYEININHVPGDIYIATFPKTGTTLVQYTCHLLRTQAAGDASTFDDIHQVSPHTSSAYYILQDLNAPQHTTPRLFKSHRRLQQLMPYSEGLKFITTIRHPLDTLISLYEHQRQRERLPPGTTIEDFAASAEWEKCYMPGVIDSLYDHLLTSYRCLHTSNLLIIPYEDLVASPTVWISRIASFMNVSSSPMLCERIAHLTSKEEMLKYVSKFDESWVAAERSRVGRYVQELNVLLLLMFAVERIQQFPKKLRK